MGIKNSKPAPPTVAEKFATSVDKAADKVVKVADKAADKVEKAIDDTVSLISGNKAEKEDAKFQDALPIVGAVVLVGAVAAYLWQKKPWRKGSGGGGAPAAA
ncbi:MAG: hypothetical protein J3K34DRAFT_524387 [Monoraphidium minutum]|nr:MAG: hypothetical protein J3K34DRAFT_524387 [Monoraphidium minutum]